MECGSCLGFWYGDKKRRKSKGEAATHNPPPLCPFIFLFFPICFSSDNDSHYRSSEALHFSLSPIIPCFLVVLSRNLSSTWWWLIRSIPHHFSLTILHSIFVNHKLYLEKEFRRHSTASFHNLGRVPTYITQEFAVFGRCQLLVVKHLHLHFPPFIYRTLSFSSPSNS